jgi:hypothetical protein
LHERWPQADRGDREIEALAWSSADIPALIDQRVDAGSFDKGTTPDPNNCELFLAYQPEN